MAAIGKVDAKNCLEILSGVFLQDMSDRLIHTFVIEKDHMSVDKETNYTRSDPQFASPLAREKIIEQFDKVGHLEVVSFLEQHINSNVKCT